jgi:tetratricopeptide (TPR) repeat protein
MGDSTLLDPVPATLVRLGEEAQLQERYDVAEGYFRKVLQLVPDHEPAQFNLGVVQLRQGKPGHAAETFESLLHRQGGLPPPHTAAATPLRSPVRTPGQLATALNLLLAQVTASAAGLVEREPNVRLAHEVTLQALRDHDAQSRRRVGVRRPIQAFLERIEGPALVLFGLAAGSEGYDRTVATPPAPPLERRSLADQIEQRDPQAALAAVDFARAEHDDGPRTLYLLAAHDAARGNTEEAAGLLQRALSSDPGARGWPPSTRCCHHYDARRHHIFRRSLPRAPPRAQRAGQGRRPAPDGIAFAAAGRAPTSGDRCDHRRRCCVSSSR